MASKGLVFGELQVKFEMKGIINNFTESLTEWESLTVAHSQGKECWAQV